MSMMGELKFFLGFEIKKLRQGTFFNQAKYIQDMLKRSDMKGTNGVGTPMALKCQLSLDPNGKPVDQNLNDRFARLPLSLHPDITISVGVCARFQESPKESHSMEVKRMFRYLVDTPNFKLWYTKDTDSHYVDSKIRIRRVTRLIESIPGFMSLPLCAHWFVGLQRGKIASLSLPPRPSMLPR
jgi:hypothetical protein